MARNSLEEKVPIFLVIAESENLLCKLICDFLRAKQLEVELLIIDNQAINFWQEKTEAYSQKNIYKIILLYGLENTLKKTSEALHKFLEFQNHARSLQIPLVLISNLSSSLEIVGDFSDQYYVFLKKQQVFLNSFLKKFSQSMVFLAKDLLLAQTSSVDYPLRLFFLLIKEKYVLVPANNFYFQDERSFFEIIKEQLIKPHQAKKFIVQGKKIIATKMANDISYLYEQYFQKKTSNLNLTTYEQIPSVFKEFTVVNNSKSNIKNILDQRIRNLFKFDNNFNQKIESSEILKQILSPKSASELKNQSSQPKPSAIKKTITNWASQLTERAQKRKLEELESTDLNAELTTKIEKLFSTQRQQSKLDRQNANISLGVEIIKKSRKRKILFYLGGIIFAFSFGVLLFSEFFQVNQKILNKAIFQIINGEEEKIEKIDKSIKYRIFLEQIKLSQKILPKDSLSEALDLKQHLELLINLKNRQIRAQKLSFELYKKTFNGEENLKSSYENLIKELGELAEEQKKYNVYLSDLNLDLYPDEEKMIWKKKIDQIRSDIKNTSQSLNFLTVFSQLLLASDRANILLLIQDSNELRATGGFLTEAIILGFNRAKLVDQQALTIDELDDRTYGSISANQEIQDLLGEKKLFLHDSNWQADFVQSGQNIVWFVEQATGNKIDMVMSLNTKTILQLLAALGELTLNNGESITQENYQAKSLLLVKSDSQANKKWQIGNAFLNKLNQISKEQLAQLNQIIINGLNQKEIFLYSKSVTLQEIIEGNIWAGKQTKMLCPLEFKQENCLVDSIFQVAANVGFNKVNVYVQEKIDHSIGIGQKFIRHKRKINIKNTSDILVWPFGTYQAYYKFYLNKQALLEKVEFDNQIINLSEIKTEESEQNKELSLSVQVPAQSQKELVVTYLVPHDESSSFSYVFHDQKQAGIYQKITNYKIVFDDQFKPQLIAPQAKYENKIISFQNLNTDNFSFAVNFNQ